MITFYDIPSAFPTKAWSPNTWKARLCLNYKGLDYKTEWVEFADIAATSKEKGLKPTGTWRDGSPYYSCPAIIDDAGSAVSESFDIALYLDSAYPLTKKVIPTDGEGGVEFQREFPKWFRETAFLTLRDIFFPLIIPYVNEGSRPYFSRTRASLFFNKASLDEVVITEEEKVKVWEEFREGWRTLDKEYYAKTDEKGIWMFGETPTFADFVVVAHLICFSLVFGEKSREWREIREWDNGRWGRLFDEAEQWRGGL